MSADDKLLKARLNQLTLADITDDDHTLVDADGFDLLCWAACHGNLELCRHLLASGRYNVNHRNNNGSAPITGASWNGHVAVVRLLLEYGANVNNISDGTNGGRPADGGTPLHRAVCQGRAEVAAVLLIVGRADTTIRNRAGQTCWQLPAFTPDLRRMVREHCLRLIREHCAACILVCVLVDGRRTTRPRLPSELWQYILDEFA
jgi:ankyrin repeat protein